LSRTEAREVVLREVEEEVREEALRRAYQKVETIREEAADRARQILALSIHRLASEVCAETTTTVVPIPSDDMKAITAARAGTSAP
jgi:ribonuclease Y